MGRRKLPPLSVENAAAIILNAHERKNQEFVTDLSTWLERSQSRSRPTPYSDFLLKLELNVRFDLLDLELSGDLGFIRTRSHGTIVPRGQKPAGSEGNREIFAVEKISGA